MERNENGFSSYNSAGERRGCAGTGTPWTPGHENMNGQNAGNGIIGSKANNGNVNGAVAGEWDCLNGSRQLAMVYAPCQAFKMLYSPEVALMHGTLFEELDKPLEDCK